MHKLKDYRERNDTKKFFSGLKIPTPLSKTHSWVFYCVDPLMSENQIDQLLCLGPFASSRSNLHRSFSLVQDQITLTIQGCTYTLVQSPKLCKYNQYKGNTSLR